MEERLPLYEQGISAGVLVRREEGLHTCFTARCPQGSGVRKLWLRSQAGGRLLLGTLVPEEGGGWGLTKRLARSGLERAGLAGPVWGELVSGSAEASAPLSQGAPASCPTPPFSPRDPVIAAALQALSQGRWQRQGANWCLTLPWQVGQPFPLLPLFCFARPGPGQLCFLLGPEGYPLIHGV